MAEKRTRYKIHELESGGSVHIADEVVTTVAALAATEVDGVKSIAGNITYDGISRLGVRNLAKGVRCEVKDSVVKVDLHLNLEYGVSIPQICQKVQEKVKSSVESMTGLKVGEVNVTIAGIALGQE